MEIEAKFTIAMTDTYTSLMAIARLGGYALSAPVCKAMHDTYLDTPDQWVAQAGYALRRRQLPDGVKMTLKGTQLSMGVVHRREEIEITLAEALPLHDLPESPFRTKLNEIVGQQAVQTLCVIEQNRCIRMVTCEGIEIAELSLDEVTLHAGAQTFPLLELEIELKGEGTEADLDTMIAALADFPGLIPQARSKLERALALVPPVAPDPVMYDAPDTPGIAAQDSMAEVVRKTLRHQLGRLLANQAGTYTGEDIEALHDMRVASRRMRAALNVFYSWLPPEFTETIRKGMKRTGRALGAVRDMDVIRVHATAWQAEQNLSDDEMVALSSAWNTAYSQRRNVMLAYLDSRSYHVFITETMAILAQVWDIETPTVAEVVPGLLQERIDAVMAYADLGSSHDAPLTRYHALRIEMKRLRYMMEFLSEVLGADVDQAIERLKTIQDHLGLLQDAVVACGHLDSELTWGTWDAPHTPYTLWRPQLSDDATLCAYYVARKTEIATLVETFPQAWEGFTSTDFMTLIASALAALNLDDNQTCKESMMTDQPKPKYVILLGPPASGKGTQAERLRDALQLPHVSSGDLFRYNLKNNTELGQKAKFYMDKGELVPDDVTIAMVLDRLAREDCAKGALLDGFPRTIPQAEALDVALAEQGNKINQALNIIVPDEALIARVTGRRLCKSCGASFHLLWKKPREEGVCDNCGGELYQRDDDTEAVARNRIDVYWKQTSPLVEYYRGKGVCVDINGDQAIDAVTAELTAAIEKI